MRRFAASGLLIFLLAVGSAVAQDFHLYGFSMYDQEHLGAGARARGMGGAFVGLADDASALTWNPAGLIQVTKTQASVAGSVYRHETENSFNYVGSSSRNLTTKLTKDLLNLEFGSFVAPIRIKGHLFVGSGTYQRIQDNSDDRLGKRDDTFYYLQPVTAYEMEELTAANFTSTQNGHVDKFSLGFGTGIYGRLSGGIVANVYSGSGRGEYLRAVLDSTELFFAGQVLDSVEFYDRIRMEDLTDLSGFGFGAGFLYQAEKVQVGVNVQLPFEMATDHDLKRADTISFRSLDAPGQGTPVAIKPTLFRAKTKVEQPLTIGFGVAAKPTTAFTVSADFEVRSSSSVKYYVRSEQAPNNSADSVNLFTLPGSIYYVDSTETSYYDAKGEYIEIFNEFELDLESSYQIRLGGEYLVPSKLGTFPLRAGFRYTKLPYRDVSDLQRNVDDQPLEGFVLGDNVTRTTFSFGTGIHWSQIHVDLAAEFSTEEQTEKGAEILEQSILEYENTRTKKSPRFFVNFTGYF